MGRKGDSSVRLGQISRAEIDQLRIDGLLCLTFWSQISLSGQPLSTKGIFGLQNVGHRDRDFCLRCGSVSKQSPSGPSDPSPMTYILGGIFLCSEALSRF